MDKIPFSIDKRPEIETGKYKVVTRGGQPVRIICWDRNSIEYPIVALVKTKCGEETSFTYGKRGNFFIADEGDNDLILVPAEPELTEFEKAVSDVVEMAWLGGKDNPYEFTKEEYAKIKSLELLSLARKELQPEIDAEVEKAYKNADRMQYEKGREDALKDRPTWKKCEDGNTDRLDLEALCLEAGSPIEIAFRANGYRIFLSDLEKLPKEE